MTTQNGNTAQERINAAIDRCIEYEKTGESIPEQEQRHILKEINFGLAAMGKSVIYIGNPSEPFEYLVKLELDGNLVRKDHVTFMHNFKQLAHIEILLAKTQHAYQPFRNFFIKWKRKPISRRVEELKMVDGKMFELMHRISLQISLTKSDIADPQNLGKRKNFERQLQKLEQKFWRAASGIADSFSNHSRRPINNFMAVREAARSSNSKREVELWFGGLIGKHRARKRPVH